jgi:hypothetical protein
MPRKGPPLPSGEIGSSGLRSSGGYLYEEFDPQLRGPRGQEKLRGMRDNSAAVGAGLHAIEVVLRQIALEIIPGATDAEGLRRAEFLEQCLHDMSYTWGETQGEALTMLLHGFALHEICYKRREGYQDGGASSKYEDGLIGWSKIALRGQETISRWSIDSHGGIQGAYQIAADLPGEVFLPIEKCVLFRVSRERNNPQGRSLLRSAWWSWYCSKRLTESMLIGVERDLNGLPVARIPAKLMGAEATAGEKAVYEAYKAMVVNIRRGEQEGIVLPSDRPEGGQQYFYDLSLLSSGGKRMFDIPQLVLQFDRWILTVLLSDMLMMGHQAVGSYALAEGKTGLFEAALNAYLELIDDAINHYAVPRLWRLNGWPAGTAAKIQHRKIDHQSLAALADYLQKLQSAQLLTTPDPALEDWLRKRAGAPRRPATPGRAATAPPEDSPTALLPFGEVNASERQ